MKGQKNRNRKLHMTLPSSSSSSWISVRGRPSSFRASGLLSTCVAAYFSCAVFKSDETVLMFCCTSDSNENANSEGKNGRFSYSRYVSREVQQLGGFPEHYLCHRAEAAFSLLCISMRIFGGCDGFTHPWASVAHSGHHQCSPTF